MYFKIIFAMILRLFSLIFVIILSSCVTIKPNWKDSVKNPINSMYKSQMDYMKMNYNQLGDSSITWYYTKIDKKL